MRHLNNIGNTFNNEDELQDIISNINEEENIRSASKKKEVKVSVRVETPTPEEKVAIRVKLFKFLDEAKVEEEQLVISYLHIP